MVATIQVRNFALVDDDNKVYVDMIDNFYGIFWAKFEAPRITKRLEQSEKSVQTGSSKRTLIRPKRLLTIQCKVWNGVVIENRTGRAQTVSLYLDYQKTYWGDIFG